MITVTHDGIEVRFDDTGVDARSPGLVHGALLKGRFYEEPFLRHIRSLRLTGCYLDIGAFIGTHTLYFSMICGADRVHAFEPRPHIMERLERNVRLNGVQDRVVLHRVALGEGVGEMSLTFGGRTDRVPAARLDDLVQDRVAVMKMDVEGMEPQVLRGAARLIRQSRPVIFAEAGTQAEYEAVEEVLRGMKYVPTGGVWNATPTYEFVPSTRRRRLADSAAGRRARAVLPLRLRRRLRRWLPQR